MNTIKDKKIRDKFKSALTDYLYSHSIYSKYSKDTIKEVVDEFEDILNDCRHNIILEKLDEIENPEYVKIDFSNIGSDFVEDYEELEQDLEDNYRPLSRSEYTGDSYDDRF